MVLFAAALTATSTAGRPADLAAEDDNEQTPAGHDEHPRQPAQSHASSEADDGS
jgi:hypothetical protein